MAAGAKTIQLLSQPGTYETLQEKTEHLAQGLQQALTESETPATINHTTGMLTLFFGIPNIAPLSKGRLRGVRQDLSHTPTRRTTSVTDMTTAAANDRQQFTRFFHNMLAQGIYLPPSPFEAWFISIAHTHEDIEATIQAARKSL